MKSAHLALSALALCANGAALTATELPADFSARPDAWNPFTPVNRPPVPPVDRPGWDRNPVDAFVAARHDALGIEPRPEAPRGILLRRLSLDLIGLPPSPAELRAFLDDSSARAYENAVDRLLASPHHGERWGRHWMDIWRYADRDRREANDGSDIPEHMWRWRDWIVASLNAGKPYDVMVKHMLAGDELAPRDPDALCATGYLARNKSKSRDIWLHDAVDHAFQAFCGLTVQCARCHDHPVDDITQIEYYQLRAIFEPHQVRTDPLPGAPDAKKDGLPRAYDADSNPRTYLYVRGNELDPDKETRIVPGVPSLVAGPAFQVEPVSLTAGDGAREKPSTGRRRALAEWMCHRDHPLTARVAVNHIWGRHFGTPLVASVNDFGGNGTPPTHPALLDWLAAEFMDCGWSMKHLHRLIVTSATYRMASTPPAGSPARNPHDLDPDNRSLWRFPPRRIEAELVRDAILDVSGRLDRALGGPPLEADRGAETLRRSLYFRHGPNTQMLFLTTFDGAVPQECYQRRASVQPQQALALWNSRLALESSRHLARALSEEAEDDSARFLEMLFVRILSRPPSAEELAIATTFIEEQTRFLTGNDEAMRGATKNRSDLRRPSADPAVRARESFVQVLFNHHEFITIR